MKIGNWITIGIFVIGLAISFLSGYFMFREDTQGGFAEAQISDVHINSEIDKLKIEIDNLKRNNAKYERDKQRVEKKFDSSIDKFDKKLDNIYNLLLK